MGSWLNKGWLSPDEAVDELNDAIDNLRDALKLAIGQANSRPWTDVTDAEVDEWLTRIRTIKATKGKLE